MSLKVNSIRWGATGEYATQTRNLELKPKLPQGRQSVTTEAIASEPGLKKRQMTTEKPGRVHHMVGDRMAGSNDEISSELPTRTGTVFMLESAEEPTEGSQSVRSSDETGNDRGAKGRRKVET